MSFFSFLSNLFGGRKTGGSLRDFIDGALPQNYVRSGKYAVDIQGSAVRITLDMLADGSDYSGFSEEDYRNVAELEGGYLLGGCLSKPPVPADFTLEMEFGGGRHATVEKKNGASVGFLTYQGQRQQITF